MRWLGFCALAALAAVLIPAALPVGAFALTGYGAALGVGTFAALTLAWKRLRQEGLLRPGRTLLCAALGALVGGHLLFCLLSLDTLPYYEAGLTVFYRPWLGGYTLYGALWGGLAGCALAARLNHEALMPTLDALAPAACLLVAVGRLAEFLTGQGIGEEVLLPLWQRFPFAVCTWADGDYSEWHAAIFVGEALTALLLCALALRKKAGGRAGHLTVQTLAALSASQIFWEQLRQDDYLRFGFVRVNQLAAILTLAVLLAAQTLSKPRSRTALLRWLWLFLASAVVITAEFALEKPHALPVLVGLLTLCALLHLVLRRSTLFTYDIPQSLVALALAILLALRLPIENPLILCAIALSCLWLGWAAGKTQNVERRM